MRRIIVLSGILAVAGVSALLLVLNGVGDANAVGISALCPPDPSTTTTTTTVPGSVPPWYWGDFFFEGYAITGEHQSHTFGLQGGGVDFDGDGLSDLLVSLVPRLSSAAGNSPTGDTPFHALLTKNFGLTPGASGAFEDGILGVDLVVSLPQKSWIRQ